MKRQIDRQTDRQTDGQRDRQIVKDTQTDRLEIDKYTHKQVGREWQVDRWTEQKQTCR